MVYSICRPTNTVRYSQYGNMDNGENSSTTLNSDVNGDVDNYSDDPNRYSTVYCIYLAYSLSRSTVYYSDWNRDAYGDARIAIAGHRVILTILPYSDLNSDNPNVMIDICT